MENRGHPKVLLILLVLISALSIIGERVPESSRAFLSGSLPALLLLGVHAILHARGLKPILLYHGVQSGLVAAIGIVSSSVSPVITLTAWMCGETVAVGATPRTRVIGATWHAAVGLLIVVLVAGSESALQWILAAVPTIAFVIVIILLYARESRAREAAQDLARELADSNRRIAEYAEQAVFRSREEERRRMARDLHDTLAQGLTGVILQIRAVEAHLNSGKTDAAKTILKGSLEQAQQTLAEARKAIVDLREADALDSVGPADSGGVVEFLRALCGDLSRRYNRSVSVTPVSLDTETEDDGAVSLPRPTVFELTNIVREAVHNAVRHGECTRVEVSVSKVDSTLELEIADDGSGFDLGQVREGGHYGIQGMKERAQALGGQLSVHSTLGMGTTVAVALPLPTANDLEARGG